MVNQCSRCGGAKDYEGQNYCRDCKKLHQRERRAKGSDGDRRTSHRVGDGDKVCNCGAYKYPHRMFGRACKPQRWVERFFDVTRSECADCLCRDGFECQVVEKQEETFHCPALRDFVRFEGIRLYGKAREAFERTQR